MKNKKVDGRKKNNLNGINVRKKRKDDMNDLKSNNSDFIKRISVREELQEENKKDRLAQKLMNGELDIFDITDEEVEQMIHWFKNDIQEKDKEINKKKEHILKMRKELKNI